MANHSEVPQEVDIIIAGGQCRFPTAVLDKHHTNKTRINTGGTTGCVVAGRLAKADPSLEILVIEGGVGTKNNPTVIHPALYPANQAPGSKTITFYESQPNEHLAGRKAVVAAGSCVGGGSSVNFMMYTRGQAIDYDDWNTEGWSAKDLVPLLRKVSGCLRRKCYVSRWYV
jgi:choline dehydrogenase-like flavoprotein